MLIWNFGFRLRKIEKYVRILGLKHARDFNISDFIDIKSSKFRRHIGNLETFLAKNSNFFQFWSRSIKNVEKYIPDYFFDLTSLCVGVKLKKLSKNRESGSHDYDVIV